MDELENMEITPAMIFKIADCCLLEWQKKQLIIMLTSSMLNDGHITMTYK